MTVRAQFHFDFGSPNAYLAHLVMPEIAARTGIEIEYCPVLIGGVFKATNNVSPMVSLEGIKNKPEYQEIETLRFLKRHSITSYTENPYFPVNTLAIMRGAVYCQSFDYFGHYVSEVFRHMWCAPKKMDDPGVIHIALTASGLPADDIIEATQTPEVKQQLIANTEDSVNRGNFGSPTFFVGDEIFFGKDKLRDMEEEILEQQARS